MSKASEVLAFVESGLSAGDSAKVLDTKKATGHPNQANLLRRAIKQGDGKVYVVRINGDSAEVAASEYDAMLGTITIPLKYLRKA